MELNGYMGIMETSKSPGPGLKTWTMDEFEVLMTHMRSNNHTPNHHCPQFEVNSSIYKNI
jgi:hypothetical protein